MLTCAVHSRYRYRVQNKLLGFAKLPAVFLKTLRICTHDILKIVYQCQYQLHIHLH